MRTEYSAGEDLPIRSGPPTGGGQRRMAGWTEADRLEALAGYDILDTPREPAFDDIVQLEADSLDAPIAVVCLIADDRQWFKAEVGLCNSETPPDVSISAQAILQPGVFVVPDAARDDRFSCNPLVTGAPDLRFYAGALLATREGLPLGTLCVLGAMPRPDGISERQRRSLAALAGQVMTQLELRRAIKRNRAHRHLLEHAQQTAGLGVWQWKVGTQVVNWSDELCQIAGRDPAAFEVTLKSALACLHPDDRQSTLAWLLGAAQNDTCSDHECRIVRPDGEVRHCWVNRSRMLGKNGTTIAVGGLCQDITERTQSEGALRESEQHYRYSVELNPQIPWTAGPDGKVEEVGPRWEALSGMLPEEACGEGWVKALHPDDVPATMVEWNEAA